jgi:hypothetical protein
MTDCIERLNFRAIGLSFEILPYRLIALSFERLAQLSSANYRSISATFERKLSFDIGNFRAAGPTFDTGSGGIRIPHEGNEHPHEGKAQGAERRGKCSSNPPRWKFWQSAERLRLDPDDGKA